MKDTTDVLLIMALETQPQEIFSLLLRVQTILSLNYDSDLVSFQKMKNPSLK